MHPSHTKAHPAIVGEILLGAARRQNRYETLAPCNIYLDWLDLFPLSFGHDNYARKTIQFGWIWTGKIGFPYAECGDRVCRRQAIEELLDV